MRAADKGNKVSLLETVPQRCAHVETEWKGECAVLAFPRFKTERMRRLMKPFGLSPYIHVCLEEHGSAVWRLIDGRRSVRELIDLLAVRFPEDETYASRISAYLMQLQKDGFIRLCLP